MLHVAHVAFWQRFQLQLQVALAMENTLIRAARLHTRVKFIAIFILFICLILLLAKCSTLDPMSHVPGPFSYYFIVGQQNVPHAIII